MISHICLSSRISPLWLVTFFFQIASSQVASPSEAAHSGQGYDNSEANNTIAIESFDKLPTYLAHQDYVGLIYAHIILMIIAWVFILPVAVMLSLAKSRHTLVLQCLFLTTNALGVFIAAIYDSQTPDLYPNNAHHKIGWIISWVVSAQVSLSLLEWVAGVAGNMHRSSRGERSSFMPVSSGSVEGDYRLSGEIALETQHAPMSPARSSLTSTLEGPESLKDCDQEDDDNMEAMPMASTYHNSFASRIVSSRLWLHFERVYRIIDRIVLPFGFIAITTGIATFGRLFEGKQIFSGLAHWIKGGVFFWLGLFTLGRWSGSFGELGWAWNLRPRTQVWQGKWRPTAEFVESALIFFYGSTNVFLEHLGGWGGKWSAQDLEHIAITVLFIGGGLCGMLVESTKVRDLLNTTVSEVFPEDAISEEERQLQRRPRTYEFSLNPIPALVILLLGTIMSSHHQASVISKMVHKQWGNLLLGASFSRVLTYILIYLRPPKSTLPSRPPTEILTAFGLISGGIMFMASSADTVKGMEHYDLNAMFMYTVTMGIVGLLMAWELTVLAIKGWAIRIER